MGKCTHVPSYTAKNKNVSEVPVFGYTTCTDFGVYLLTCKICGKRFLRKCSVLRRKRVSFAESLLKVMDDYQIRADSELVSHFNSNHLRLLNNKNNYNTLAECYSVTLLEKDKGKEPGDLNAMFAKWRRLVLH